MRAPVHPKAGPLSGLGAVSTVQGAASLRVHAAWPPAHHSASSAGPALSATPPTLCCSACRRGFERGCLPRHALLVAHSGWPAGAAAHLRVDLAAAVQEGSRGSGCRPRQQRRPAAAAARHAAGARGLRPHAALLAGRGIKGAHRASGADVDAPGRLLAGVLHVCGAVIVSLSLLNKQQGYDGWTHLPCCRLLPLLQPAQFRCLAHKLLLARRPVINAAPRTAVEPPAAHLLPWPCRECVTTHPASSATRAKTFSSPQSLPIPIRLPTSDILVPRPTARPHSPARARGKPLSPSCPALSPHRLFASPLHTALRVTNHLPPLTTLILPAFFHTKATHILLHTCRKWVPSQSLPSHQHDALLVAAPLAAPTPADATFPPPHPPFTRAHALKRLSAAP